MRINFPDHHQEKGFMSIGPIQKAGAWVPKKFQDTEETSAERTKAWVEPKMKMERRNRVAVVYYLSRNGLLEHPHFMEVPLSSPAGLFLRDVIKRLNCVRGQGMANMYSWSSKRNYKSGYVWQDLTENDLIHPCNGHEYILKGSQLPTQQPYSLGFRPPNTVSSSSATSNASSATNQLAEEPLKSSDAIEPKKSMKQQLYNAASLDDLEYYRVYIAKTSTSRKALNASTQTVVDGMQKKREDRERPRKEERYRSCSPRPSNSSTEDSRESLDHGSTLLAREGHRGRQWCEDSSDIRNQAMERERPSGRLKASAALMQLIMCGSKGVDEVDYPLHATAR